MLKKTRGNDVFRRWYEAALHRPELFVDVPEGERCKEAPAFKEHRHDQSVLTACVCTCPRLNRLCFLPEKMEKVYRGGQALIASRISATGMRGRNQSFPAENRLVGWLNLHVVKPFQIATTVLLFRLSQWLAR